jgi:hypothetical protein
MSGLRTIKELMERLSRTAGARMAEVAATTPMAPDIAERLREATVLMRRQNLGDLKAGRLLNVHESGKTATPHGGKKASEVRGLYEPQLLGGLDLNYGYLTEDPHATFKLPLATRYPDRGDDYLSSISDVAPYGQYALELKPHMKERTSFTLGDSLDGSRGPTDVSDVLRPFSPYQNVIDPDSPLAQLARQFDTARESIALDNKTLKGDTWDLYDMMRREGLGETFQEYVAQKLGQEAPAVWGRGGPRVGGYYWPRQSPRPVLQPDWRPVQPSESLRIAPDNIDAVLKREGDGGIQNYIEAQVHGGVTPEDVSRVYELAPEGSAATEKALRRLGIEYVPPPAGNVGERIVRGGLKTYNDLIEAYGPDIYGWGTGNRLDLSRGPQRKYDQDMIWSDLPRKVRFADGGTIKPTPRNSGLGAVADALRATRDWANKAEIPVLGGVGDILLGKTPEELDDWSYGNSPFDRGYAGLSDRLPRLKPKRREQVADTLFTLPGLLPVKTVGKGAKALGRESLRRLDNAMLTGEGPLAMLAGAARPMTAVRPRGGNFDLPADPETWGRAGWIPENLDRNNPIYQWQKKQLGNYIKRDLGAPTDPLLALEKELPNLHLPGDLMEDMRFEARNFSPAALAERERDAPPTAFSRRAREYLTRHQELAGADTPITAWTRLADSNVVGDTAGDYVKAEVDDMLPSIMQGYGHSGETIEDMARRLENHLAEGYFSREPKKVEKIRAAINKLRDKNDWRVRTPDADIWRAVNPMSDDVGGLGFNHVLDYLEEATGPYKGVSEWMASHADRGGPGISLQEALKEIQREGERSMLPLRGDDMRRWKALMDAGLALDPESLQRLSVPDAVRKTAQWNEFMANQAVADGPLSKGWRTFKEYPDDPKGLRWVEFGKPDVEKLPEGWSARNNSIMPDQKVYINELGEEVRSHPDVDALREGLRAEGDAMGHCVGGYCDDVLGGRTKIYSLRDAKGKPHVTIETQQRKAAEFGADALEDWANNASEESVRDAIRRYRAETGRRLAYDDNVFEDDDFRAFMLKDLGVAATPEEALISDIIQIKGKQNAAPVADYLPYVQDFVRSGKWGRVGDLRNTGLRHIPDRMELGDPTGGTHALDAGYYSESELLDWAKKVNPAATPESLRRWLNTVTVKPYASGGSVRAEEPAAPGFLPRSFADWVEYTEGLYAPAAER